MGLKKKNYTSEKLGLKLPNAYAMIKRLDIFDNRGRAEFHIQTSRENAMTLQPIEIIVLDFEFNPRSENPLTIAYDKAKGREVVQRTRYIRAEDPNTGEVTFTQEPYEEYIDGILYGWADDIAEEETEE